MLDLPAPSAAPGDFAATDLDRSPVAVVDADEVSGSAELRAQWGAVRRRAVLVGVLRDCETDAGLLDLLDIAIAPRSSAGTQAPGVVVSDDVDADLGALLATGVRSPHATWALARLLRLTEALPVEAALVAESATYSALLGGAEFRRWLAERDRPGRRADDQQDREAERVRCERQGDQLEITLTRPRRRNAYDARMRDALLEAFDVAVLEPRVAVSLRGEGPDFCAGGDLDEFGSATDLALAHRLRVGAHPGLVVEAMRERVTVHLHGSCIGSGIELAAFAGTVLARPDVSLGLPELAMGLVPGAGGTVSLTRRIGRHRVLWWAMSGRRLGLDVALEWGLVDGVGT
ncbi:enoyl-CoA hydratase/isomerase family protein [Nocardioides sp. SYSU DS0651]|uniref:enoyl-CoA hydratase/isomerase family protein n=1 Tax=Nocardioides sp. SYSU DS0651 TaxID=3415955 RepID=UPI003F4C5538